MRRAQSGFEFLAITALGLFLVTTVSLIALSQTRGQQDDAAMRQSTELADTLIQQAQIVWALGRNSWVTVTAQVPSGVRDIAVVENDTIVTSLDTTSGHMDLQRFSPVPLAGVRDTGTTWSIYPAAVHTGTVSIRVANNGTAVVLSAQ